MAKRKKKKAKKDQGAEQKPVSSKVQIQRSFNKATKLLGQMLRGPDPLYRMPFFGVVGAPGTFKGELLADEGLSPRPGCPHDFGVAGASRNDWWFYNNAVVIDFSPAFFEDAAPDEDADAADEPSGGLMGRLRKRGAANADEDWKTTLDALRKARPLRPLDGMIVVVDAAGLILEKPEDQSTLARRAEKLAEKVHEAQFRLGVHFPVFVVVSGCEALSGFSVFADALPDAMRDQMFGWSSPHDPESGYQSEWVDEAVGSLHEAVSVSQLELLPQVRGQTELDALYLLPRETGEQPGQVKQRSSQSERDALYLLPREVGNLRGPLTIVCDALFKATSFRRGLPLRGIYLSARIGHGADPGPPRFIRQVFTEKIFQEPGLAKLDDDQKRVVTRKLRRARIALAAVVVLGSLSVVGQRYVTGNKIEDFAGLVTIMRNFEDKAKYGAVVDLTEAGRGMDALKALADTNVDSFDSLLAPTSYFDDLDERTNLAIATVLGDGVGRPLRDALALKGDQRLPPGLDSELPKKAGLGTPEQAADVLEDNSPSGHMKAIGTFAAEVLELQVNFERYQNHDTRDLGQLYKFLTGEDITKQLENKEGLYRRALREIKRWPELEWERYRMRARRRLQQLRQRMEHQLFQRHPLRVALDELQASLMTLRNDETKGLRRTLEAIRRVEALIEDERADWMLAEKFEPGPGFPELVKTLDGKGFAVAGKAKEEKGPGTLMAAAADKLFTDLREAVLSAQYKADDDVVRFLARKDGRMALSEELRAIRDALKKFFGQPYVIEDDGPFLAELQRNAGVRNRWNGDYIAKVLLWHKSFSAYTEAQHPGVPGSVIEVMVRSARLQYRSKALTIMEHARPKIKAGPTEGGTGDWTTQRKEDLKTRIRNLADQYQSILATTKAIDEINAALAEVAGTELFNYLRDDADNLLDQVDGILDAEKPYSVRGDQFSWWDSDQPPGVVAFAARDVNDLLARLGVQRKTIEDLATEFARPLVDVMLALGPPYSESPEVDKWSKIIAVLTDYEKKVPGNSLEDLERFIEVELNKIQLANCEQQLEGQIDRYNRDDFFKDRKYTIGTTMVRRCNDILKRVTLSGYVDLQRYFSERLSGRFPFAGPDVLAEVETGDVLEFYKMFDRYSGAFKALVRPAGGASRALFGEATAEVLRFIQQVEKARALFGPLLASEDDNPDLILDSDVEFRVNRDNEVNGNQIIQWWAQIGDQRINHRDNKRGSQWRTNDGYSVCFRWAKDAMFLPAVNQRAEHARVNGRTVCYAFSGRWAMLRLLNQHASTPADRGRRSFLRPHTLRFETETSLASAARGATSLLVTDTRVYVRVGLQLPGAKSAFRMPEFPRRAPELTKEFLKSNGIADTRGGSGSF